MAAHLRSPEEDRRRASELLEVAIAQRWPGARARALENVPGDASSRRYLRCTLERETGATGSADAKFPDSLVVMLMEDAAVAMSSEELGVFGEGGPDELPFLNVARFLSRRTDTVPTIYAVADDNSAMVLEDVGDVPLWDAARQGDGGGTEELFGLALDTIAEIQAGAVDDGSGCYAFKLAFDEQLFTWEFEHFLEFGVRDGDCAATKACRKELTRAAQELGALPRVFCHRDYHAWNIHVQPGPRIRIIDFQDALMGPSLYDVASLLTDRTTPDIIDGDTRNRLLSRYARAVERESASTRADEGRLRREYALCAMQRALKVIGRFNYLAEVKGKTGYSRFLPWEIATARSAVAALPEFSATAELLDGNVKGG